MAVLTTGKAAPHFKLTSLDGKKYSLQEGLAKGPVLAAFFKVACPTCQYTFPFLERLFQQLRPHGVQVWGIVQDEARDAQRFAKEWSVNFPILVDDYPYGVSRQYRLEYVPTVFLIEPDGHIGLSSEGFCKADLIEVQRLLSHSLSATPGALFLPKENIPEYKPG